MVTTSHQAKKDAEPPTLASRMDNMYWYGFVVSTLLCVPLPPYANETLAAYTMILAWREIFRAVQRIGSVL